MESYYDEYLKTVEDFMRKSRADYEDFKSLYEVYKTLYFKFYSGEIHIEDSYKMDELKRKLTKYIFSYNISKNFLEDNIYIENNISFEEFISNLYW